MEILLRRQRSSAISTISCCYIDGKPFCHVLEDVVRPAGTPKVFGKTAIPAGTYQVIVTMSNRFRQLMPLLVGVPGYEGVRIHSGNTAADTEGCLLVGQYDPRKPDWVSNSRATYDQLFARIQRALGAGQRVTVQIVDAQ